MRQPLAKEEREEEGRCPARSRFRRFVRRCGLRTGGRRRSAPASRREGRAGQTAGEGRGRKGEAKAGTGRTESQEGDRARSAEGEKASGREAGYTALSPRLPPVKKAEASHKDAPARSSSTSSLERTKSLARVAGPVPHRRELSWAATVG